jgi:hypothetical protein
VREGAQRLLFSFRAVVSGRRLRVNNALLLLLLLLLLLMLLLSQPTTYVYLTHPSTHSTFPADPSIPPYRPGRPASGSLPFPGVPQLHGWTWGSYWGAQGNESCPAVPYPRYTCVSNDSHYPPRTAAFCVDTRHAGPFFPFPTIDGDDPTCGGHCKPLPPGQHMPLPPHCHPAPPAVRYACDKVNGNCFPSPGGQGSNQTACEVACQAPTPPPPRPPLSSAPCIRFIHALPIEHSVDVVITQQQDSSNTASDTPIQHSWSNYAFADHSNWVSVFKSGVGTMDVYENVGGQRGTHPLYSKQIPLTPGPLVVAIKIGSDQDPKEPSKYWPPNEPDQIETIAASYTPPTAGDASVRLFNLSPTTLSAGMTSSAQSGATITGVKYSLGSAWESFALGNQSWSFVDDNETPPSQLLQTQAAPKAPPIGNTMFFLGLQGVNLRALMLSDAPEVCQLLLAHIVIDWLRFYLPTPCTLNCSREECASRRQLLEEGESRSMRSLSSYSCRSLVEG